jgi:hypothetical protein
MSGGHDGGEPARFAYVPSTKNSTSHSYTSGSNVSTDCVKVSHLLGRLGMGILIKAIDVGSNGGQSLGFGLVATFLVTVLPYIKD